MDTGATAFDLPWIVDLRVVITDGYLAPRRFTYNNKRLEHVRIRQSLHFSCNPPAPSRLLPRNFPAGDLYTFALRTVRVNSCLAGIQADSWRNKN